MSSQLKGMSVQELKAKLRRVGISASDCIEKDDLLQRLQTSGHFRIVEDEDSGMLPQASVMQSRSSSSRSLSCGSPHASTAEESSWTSRSCTPGASLGGRPLTSYTV